MRRWYCWMAWILKKARRRVSFSFFFLRVKQLLSGRCKCGVWNSVLLTPGWGKARCLGEPVSTKAGRWWEQSMKILRLGISLCMRIGSRGLWGSIWRRTLAGGGCGRRIILSNVRLKAIKKKSVPAEFAMDAMCHHTDLEAWGNFSGTRKTELFFSITLCHQSVTVLFSCVRQEKKKEQKIGEYG